MRCGDCRWPDLEGARWTRLLTKSAGSTRSSSHRPTPRPRHDARAAPGARSLAGGRQGARAADRSQPALLRLGAAARPSRALAPGAGLLHHRRQELWPRPDLPAPTGYEQARSVVAAIAGDLEAADDLQLVLPRPASARPTSSRTAPAAVAVRRRRKRMPAASPTTWQSWRASKAVAADRPRERDGG